MLLHGFWRAWGSHNLEVVAKTEDEVVVVFVVATPSKEKTASLPPLEFCATLDFS
jgi:hypothetical protein